MPAPREHRIVLTGPKTGQTVNLQGYQFDKGVLVLHDTPENVGGVINYLGRSY